jgi:hypothetical protein
MWSRASNATVVINFRMIRSPAISACRYSRRGRDHHHANAGLQEDFRKTQSSYKRNTARRDIDQAIELSPLSANTASVEKMSGKLKSRRQGNSWLSVTKAQRELDVKFSPLARAAACNSFTEFDQS